MQELPSEKWLKEDTPSGRYNKSVLSYDCSLFYSFFNFGERSPTISLILNENHGNKSEKVSLKREVSTVSCCIVRYYVHTVVYTVFLKSVR